jgi:hypothetical protein
MHKSLESGSKLTARRDKHLEKQQSHQRSTEAGTEIDESERQLTNTKALIRDSQIRMPPLRVTVTSDSSNFPSDSSNFPRKSDRRAVRQKMECKYLPERHWCWQHYRSIALHEHGWDEGKGKLSLGKQAPRALSCRRPSHGPAGRVWIACVEQTIQFK